MNRRRPFRWLRTLLRHLNATLGACVVVMALAMAHTVSALIDERAARLEAEESAAQLALDAALRDIEDASWELRFRNVVKGEEFEWRQRKVRGGT